MTFRSGKLRKSKTLTLSDLSVGQKVDGRVKRVTDFGIFVSIEDTKLTGLCHKLEVRVLISSSPNRNSSSCYQIADNIGSDVSVALRNFREGDTVRAVVLALDSEKQRISLGLKPSYFEDDENNETDGAEVNEDSTEANIAQDGETVANAGLNGGEESGDTDSDDDDAMSVDMETLQQTALLSAAVPSQRTAPPARLTTALELQGGFQWGGMDNVNAEQLDDSSSGDESDVQLEKRKKKRKKQIEYDVTGEMHSKLPESVSDFERRLLGSPNSSYLWIQYMSFQLQLSEVDKAREVGRRALQTINFREEQEKLNVWIAMLNIENSFGTEEGLEIAFKEAARTCDSKTIHLRLAAILDQSEKHEVSPL